MPMASSNFCNKLLWHAVSYRNLSSTCIQVMASSYNTDGTFIELGGNLFL